jgi:hypothetical protein
MTKLLLTRPRRLARSMARRLRKGVLKQQAGFYEPEPSRLRYEVWDEEGAIDAFETREAAENALETAGDHYGGNPYVVDSYMKMWMNGTN